MTRYHFNVYDGARLLDDEGTELPDWQRARLEVLRRAGKILRDDTQKIAAIEDWRIEVTDSRGLILFQMTFVMVEAPALQRSRTERVSASSHPSIADPDKPDLPMHGEPLPTGSAPGDPPMPPPTDPVLGEPIEPTNLPADPNSAQPTMSQ